MELPKTKKALAAGVAAAGIVTTAVLTMAVWPALTRPDPPLEKASDDGLRIRLVQPPKAAAASAGPLDVGLSEAAQAMAKGRQALFVRTAPVRPSPAPRDRPAPARAAWIDDPEDDVAPPPPEPVDDRWEREAWRRDRFEQARFERARQIERRRWEEEERLAREAGDERVAWARDRRDRRWEEPPEQDRYDDRAPPTDADPPASGPW